MTVEASATAAAKANGIIVNCALDSARDAMSSSMGRREGWYAALAWYPACYAVVSRRYSLSAWPKWVLNAVSVRCSAVLALHSLLAMGKRPFSLMMRVPVRIAAVLVIVSLPSEANFMQYLSCSKRLSTGLGGVLRCAHAYCVDGKLVVINVSIRRPGMIKEELCGD